MSRGSLDTYVMNPPPSSPPSFLQVEMRVSSILAGMEAWGFGFDCSVLAVHRDEVCMGGEGRGAQGWGICVSVCVCVGGGGGRIEGHRVKGGEGGTGMGCVCGGGPCPPPTTHTPAGLNCLLPAPFPPLTCRSNAA